ncbi:MAG: hypothetical protein V4538_13715 [Bacteroidota bacterium]
MIKKYFSAEQAEGILLSLFGVISFSTSVVLSSQTKDPFYYGMSITLFLFSIVQIILGIVIIAKARNNKVKVKAYSTEKTENMLIYEMPRVLKQITMNKIMVIVFFGFLVFATIILFITIDNISLKGLASGMLLQSILLIIALLYSNKRAEEYLQWIKHYFN